LDQSIGIIIPVYNEGENIKETVQAIEDKISAPHRIYIVYDFDEDNTLPAARELIKSGINLIPIKNTGRGVINAIKTGLQRAEDDYLLVTMADMSDDYSVVDKMYKSMLEGYDIVCGSRYVKGGRQISGPLIKKTLSRIAGVSLWYLAGLPTHDATNSFKLYRKSILDTIKIESNGGFEIGIELVTKAHFAGYKVTEVSCVWRDRVKGRSRFRIIKWAPKYLRWYFYAIKNKFKYHSIEKLGVH
jgi:glycosyltransferase involved in cell wall biosynthesis